MLIQNYCQIYLKRLFEITQSIDLQQSQTNYTTIEQFRSNQWIVLIDDEPSIRLAIGDYLFSNGYSVD